MATRPNTATRIVDLMKGSNVELFHDQRKDPHLAINEKGYRRIIPMGSQDFMHLIGYRTHCDLGIDPGTESMNTAVRTLKGMAVYAGPQRDLHVRAVRQNGILWIDLDGKRAVKVTPGHWEVVAPPILFRPISIQKPLPDPVRGGDMKRVLESINLTDPASQLLFLTFLVIAHIPDIPIPLLVLQGSQGSGKSTAAKIAKKLIDPTSPLLEGEPEKDSWATVASQHRMLALDNITKIPPWLSAALCRVVYDEGHVTRKYYTNLETVNFEFRNVVAIASIHHVVTMTDLLDRTIQLEFPSIGGGTRREEKEFWGGWETFHGEVFGGILDVLAETLAIDSTINLERKPRMADFARMGAAASQVMGYGVTAFLQAYQGVVEKQHETAIETNPLVQVIAAYMEECDEEVAMTPTALLKGLKDLASEHRIDTRTLPPNPSELSKRLSEIDPTLRSIGLEIEKGGRKAGRRVIVLRRTGETGPVLDLSTDNVNVSSLLDTMDGVDGTFSTSSINSLAPKKGESSHSPVHPVHLSKPAPTLDSGEDGTWTGQDHPDQLVGTCPVCWGLVFSRNWVVRFSQGEPWWDEVPFHEACYDSWVELPDDERWGLLTAGSFMDE